jgi:hypothetical protein
MKKLASFLFLAAACTASLCGAALAQTPPAALVSCTRMPDPGERLRCYDTQMAAMGALESTAPAAPSTGAGPSSPPSNPVVAAAAPPPPPAMTPSPPPPPDAKFGADDLKRSARPKETDSDRVLLSKIASIKEARPKLWIIVLANGQIWMQEGTQITSFFKVGFDARIEKGLFSNYRMATEQTGEKNMVAVTRIQ